MFYKARRSKLKLGRYLCHLGEPLGGKGNSMGWSGCGCSASLLAQVRLTPIVTDIHAITTVAECATVEV